MKTLFLVATLISCFLLCGFQGEISSSQREPAPQVASANKQKAGGGKKAHLAAPPIQPATDAADKNVIGPAGQRQDDKVAVTALPPEIAIKQIKDSIDRTVMWCTIILTIVGVVGTIAAVRTLRQVKRQADTLDEHRAKFEDLATAASNNAAAARDLVAANEAQRNLMEAAGRHTQALAEQAVRQTELTQAQLELSHRPWISVDIAPASPLVFDERGAVLMFNVTMKNVGHSVAKHVSLWMEFVVAGVHDLAETSNRLSNIMKQPVNEHSDYGWLLFPNQLAAEPRPAIAQPSAIQRALESGHFKDVGAIGLHLVGCVDYPSSFDPKKRHQTRFVYLVGRIDEARGVVMGTFEPKAKIYHKIVLTPTGHGASAD
jgi:hypothetical protein